MREIPPFHRMMEISIFRGIKQAFSNENLSENNELTSFRNYNDTSLPDLPSHPYNMTYSKFSFLPRLFIDSSRVKLGTYFYASDILDRYSVLGGIAANMRKDL